MKNRFLFSIPKALCKVSNDACNFVPDILGYISFSWIFNYSHSFVYRSWGKFSFASSSVFGSFNFLKLLLFFDFSPNRFANGANIRFASVYIFCAGETCADVNVVGNDMKEAKFR